MKILIMAGGTGSIALQRGLYDLTSDFEDVDIKVLVNAYDNGLSTGAVRKVYGGKILGPSDVRKNQTTRFALEQPNSPWNGFLNHRFTAQAKDAKTYCMNSLDDLVKALVTPNPEHIASLRGAINNFFSQSMADKIDYDDFSLSNIIYAGLAGQNGNSLRAAARIMSKILGIKDNVILNDDTSLFLGAVTKSGKKITDEGDIVAWKNPDDPFVDVMFVDAYGEERMPRLCEEASNVIKETDVIILSSGTQWSSLIPTYASLGFKYALGNFQGKVVMVMNRQPDYDAPEQSASDIINTLVPTYFRPKQIDLIIDSTGHELMRKMAGADNLCRTVSVYPLADGWSVNPRVHDQDLLAHAVLKTIYQEYLGAGAYVFDYDDTLVGRGNSHPNSSRFNITMVRRIGCGKFPVICTGNSIKTIKLNVSDRLRETTTDPITIFADGGINEYAYERFGGDNEEYRHYKFIECLVPEARFSQTGPGSIEEITARLCAIGIPSAKIENRGDVMISIKPIDPEYRKIVAKLLEYELQGEPLDIKIAGRTTIEIMSPLVSKEPAVKKLLKMLSEYDMVYVGDEFKNGNDKIIADLANTEKRIKCLSVRSPSDTALFLTALIH